MSRWHRIDGYVDELAHELARFRALPFGGSRLLAEAREHLIDAARALETSGLPPDRAEFEAIRHFGPADNLALESARLDWKGVLAMIKLGTGALATLTTFMASAVVTVALLQASDMPLWLTAKLGVGTFTVLQGVATLTRLLTGRISDILLKGGAMMLLAVGLLVGAGSSYVALTGPDPEYWVVMLGGMMVGQALGTVLFLRGLEWSIPKAGA